tara:strand:+ start:1299 stop:1733 length:435 start_codon:yes stop_codon:yes gene_type:complete
MAIIKFPEDTPTKVTLDFDGPRTVEGDYGTQYQYGCNGGEDIFYASASLSSLIELTGATKGSEISIAKLQGSDPKTGKTFLYFTVNGKSIDDLSAPRVADSPLGVGFAHKDTKAGPTIADLDARITALEEKVKDGRETEEVLPF